MIGDHVAERAGLFIEGPAAFDADRFGNRDLDVVDVIAVPERLEDSVSEAHHHHVLNRLLPKVVVDPVNLVLVEHAEKIDVEALG